MARSKHAHLRSAWNLRQGAQGDVAKPLDGGPPPRPGPGAKTILVTGGAGFLGSHLCRRLLAQGHHVVCLDDLSTGRTQNIQPLMREAGFRFLKRDVADPIELPVDEIYNLASPASPIDYQRDPVRTLRTSVFGALNVLQLAADCGAKVLQASTSEVYGDPHVHPQPESYWGNVNPIGVRACYDEGKRCAETLFFDYARQHRVRIKVARIFNTYGPRMRPDDGRVVSNFLVQALSGRKLSIYGDGSQTRSYCFVDDMVDGLIRLMGSADSVTGPINLGNPGEFTVRELAEMVLALTGAEVGITYLPLPLDDPRQRRPDISRAREMLDWSPTVPLSVGLERTAAYFAEVCAVERASAAE